MSKKTKMITVNNYPIVMTTDDGYTDFTFYGRQGSVNYSFWPGSDKKETNYQLKELGKLIDMLDAYRYEVSQQL